MALKGTLDMPREVWLFSPICLVGLLALTLSGRTLARDQGINGDGLDPKVFSSDQDTATELTRISALKPGRSPFLNESTRQEVHDTLLGYNANLNLLNDFLTKQSGDVEGKVGKQFDNLAEILSGVCNPEPVKSTRSEITGVMHYVQESDQIYERVMQRNGTALLDQDRSPEGRAMLIKDPGEFCKDYKDSKQLGQLRDGYLKQLHNAKEKLVADQEAAKSIVPRIQELIEAWTKYRETLGTAIEEASGAQGKVADQLWYIILLFCVFSVVIFGIVKIFPPAIQLELVASGQVIQFATVMVILIVVCVLGISNTLHENTLGTLLGAIGGYVLSQGVGRAASRAATQAALANAANRGQQKNGNDNQEATQNAEGQPIQEAGATGADGEPAARAQPARANAAAATAKKDPTGQPGE
jgi:hypothetical protein